jgi:hypothetical protein
LDVLIGYGAGIFQDLGAPCDFAEADSQLRRDFSLGDSGFQHLHQLPSQRQIGDFRPGEYLTEKFPHGLFVFDFNEGPDQFAVVNGPDSPIVSMHRNNLIKKNRKVKEFLITNEKGRLLNRPFSL